MCNKICRYCCLLLLLYAEKSRVSRLFLLLFFLLCLPFYRMNFRFVWCVMKILVHLLWFWKQRQQQSKWGDAHLFIQLKCTECNLYLWMFRCVLFSFECEIRHWNYFVRVRVCVTERAFAVIKFRLYWWWCLCFPIFYIHVKATFEKLVR